MPSRMALVVGCWGHQACPDGRAAILPPSRRSGKPRDQGHVRNLSSPQGSPYAGRRWTIEVVPASMDRYNVLPGTLIERTFRERIVLVGVVFPGLTTESVDEELDE